MICTGMPYNESKHSFELIEWQCCYGSISSLLARLVYTSSNVFNTTTPWKAAFMLHYMPAQQGF